MKPRTLSSDGRSFEMTVLPNSEFPTNTRLKCTAAAVPSLLGDHYQKEAGYE